MNVLEKIRQFLIKAFTRRNKRFPTPVDFDQLDMEARKIFDGAYRYNLDQSKGMNLDEGQVMEQTMNKNADQLVDDYLSYEASNIQPTFTQVDERTLPRAEIEALPLKDKEKAEAAVKKKLEAQNIQATQAKKGGTTPGAPQRGQPELVDEKYGNTVYIDKSEMTKIMDDAYRFFEQAENAISQGNYDDARAILRYEIEDNYKYPQEVRDAAYDARVFIRRGEGVAKDMGYETEEEALEALNEKISEGIKKTSPDNWPMFTARDEQGDFKNIEYVDFLDEPGEDFGTPNSKISSPSDIDYNYATGGRVGFSAGGIKSTLMKMFSTGGKKQGARDISENLAELLDIVDQAEKAGIKFNTLKELENFVKATKGVSLGLYKGKMEPVEGVEGLLSGLPKGVTKGEAPKTNLAKVRAKVESDKKGIETLARDEQIPVREDLDRELTEDEIDDLIGEVGDLDAYDFDGTVGSANRIRKEYKDYMDDMYRQYKAGKLDPSPGEVSRSRMKYLQDKKQEAEMTDDFRLFTPDDRDELEFLESQFEYTDLREKLDSPRKMTDDDLKKLKEFDDSGFEDFSKEMNRINRKKNAEGGLNYLLGF